MPHINIFIAYAPENRKILSKLLKHLKPMEQFGQIRIWHEGKIRAGQDRQRAIEGEIRKAHIILLLVSSDFLVSDYCINERLAKTIQQRYEQNFSRVIPVIAEECDWRWKGIFFHNLKPLPNEGIPITDNYWGNIDKPCKEIAKEIRKQVAELQTRLSNPLQKQPQTKKTRKKGQVLYRIPSKMKKGMAHSCIIRIAPKDLPEDLQKELLEGMEGAKLEGIRRIDQLMKVELLDESNGGAFGIALRGKAEQAIVEDDYTEWKYEVTPLLEGKHLLILQVSITIIQAHGKEYQNVVVLQKEIQVVTENTTQKAYWEKPKNAPLLLVPSTLKRESDVGKVSRPTTPQAKIRFLPFLRNYRNPIAIFLLFLLFVPTVTWAVAPEIMVNPYLDWVYAAHKEVQVERIAVKDTKTQKWGAVNKHGIQSSPPKYDHIEQGEAGTMNVRKDGKWRMLAPEDRSHTSRWSQFWNNMLFPNDIEMVSIVSETRIKILDKENIEVQIKGCLYTLPKLPPHKIGATATQQLKKAIEQLPKAEKTTLQEIQQLLEKGDTTALQEVQAKLKNNNNPAITELVETQKNILLQKRIMELYKAVESDDTQQILELKTGIQALQSINDSQKISIPSMPEDAYKEETTAPVLDPQTNGDGVLPNSISIPETPKQENVPSLTANKKPSKNTPLSTPDKNPSKNPPSSTSNENPSENTPPSTSNTKPPKDTIPPTPDKEPQLAPYPSNSNEKSSKDTLPSNSDKGIETDTPTPTSNEKLSEKPIDQLLQSIVAIQGGTFQMGCTSEQEGECGSAEKPVHTVTVDDFKMGKYEVTQAQWKAVMGTNPSRFQGCDNCPVESVSWNDVQDFIKKLNKQTGKKFRLPTEAEWEFAARGGSKSKGFKYAGSNNIDEVAWYGSNSASKTHPVGTKKANELGLYDMSGNVFEWVEDCWKDTYKNAPSDGKTWTVGNCNTRVLRGGSWYYDSVLCRSSFRYYFIPDNRDSFIGFRCVLDF